MIESVKLTDEQVHVREQGSMDWLLLTSDQYELIRTCGPDRACMFLGDELVRMPKKQVAELIKSAFDCAYRSAFATLGLEHGENVRDVDMRDMEFGDQFVHVTVTALDGRTAAASGAISLRETMQ